MTTGKEIKNLFQSLKVNSCKKLINGFHLTIENPIRDASPSGGHQEKLKT